MIDALAEILDKDRALLALDRLTLPSEGGDRIGVRFGFGVELYTSDSDRKRIRENFLAVLADYQKRYPGKLNRFLPDDATRMRKVSGDPAAMVASDMARVGLDEGYGTILLGDHGSGPSNDDVSRFALGTLVQRIDDKRSSFLEAYFPIAETTEVGDGRQIDLLEGVLAWCECFRPNHGSAGLIVQLRFDSQHQTSGLAFPILKRFPGIGFPSAGIFVFEARAENDRIKCVNWLTVLSDKLVDDLGGLDAMRSAVEPICRIHRYSGGVVIQAGEYPQIGDTNRQQIPDAYRVVAKWTRKVRFEGYKSGLFKVPKPLDAREETLAWVRRFD